MPQALHQIDDLAFPLHVKIKFVVSFGCLIDRFLQIHQWFDNLMRQGIADPDTDEKSDERYNPQRLFRLTNKMSSFGVIFLDQVPIHGFEQGCFPEDFLARSLKILGHPLQFRISVLNRLRYLGIKGANSFAEFLKELSSFTML